MLVGLDRRQSYGVEMCWKNAMIKRSEGQSYWRGSCAKGMFEADNKSQ